MSGKFGVKETLELFDLGFGIAAAGRQALADGKVNFLDIGAVVPVFPKVVPAIADIHLVPSELGELDEQDSAQILAYAKSKLPEISSVEEIKKKIYVYIKAGLAVGEAIAIS